MTEYFQIIFKYSLADAQCVEFINVQCKLKPFAARIRDFAKLLLGMWLWCETKKERQTDRPLQLLPSHQRAGSQWEIESWRSTACAPGNQVYRGCWFWSRAPPGRARSATCQLRVAMSYTPHFCYQNNTVTLLTDTKQRHTRETGNNKGFYTEVPAPRGTLKGKLARGPRRWRGAGWGLACLLTASVPACCNAPDSPRRTVARRLATWWVCGALSSMQKLLMILLSRWAVVWDGNGTHHRTFVFGLFVDNSRHTGPFNN